MANTLARVVKCVETATRYPQQLLVPEADLETDLGIDSVKRVEIVTELSSEFNLDLLNQEDAPEVRTIQQIVEWIAGQIQEPAAGQTAPTSQPAPHTQAAISANQPEPAHFQSAHASPVPTVSSSANAQVNVPTNQPANGQNGRPIGAIVPPPHFANTNGVNAPSGNPMAPTAYGSVPRQPAPAAQPNGQPQSTTKKLTGKTVFITGSGHGVGRTIARLMASQGATVIVNSFHSRDRGEQTAADIRAEGGSAAHLWGSVCNPDQVNSIFDQIDSQYGGLDVLICNASDGKLGSFTDITPEDWNRAFTTNVSGHYHCAMRASELMKRRGGGSIITMSSVAAQRYVQGMGCQGVVKAAVEAMTRNLACELAPWGIRANCVSGGAVYGDVMSNYPETRTTFNYWEQIVPDGELCNPMDLANAISFLISDDARGVNGATWTVDHGASTRAHTRALPQLTNNNPHS